MNTELERKQIRVFKKEFENLQQVLSDDVCKKHIQEQIGSLLTKRIVNPPPGMKWKRTGYDVLQEQSNLNATYFIQAYPLIEEKKSTLPSSIRSLIEDVVVRSIRKTIETHSVIVEERMTFRIKGSKTLEVGFIESFNTESNIMVVKFRKGKVNRIEEIKFDEAMEKFKLGNYYKL